MEFKGKEIISRFDLGDADSVMGSSDGRDKVQTLDNGGVWYTDSNGRELIRRQRNHRDTWNLTNYEPVVQNYFPAIISLLPMMLRLPLPHHRGRRTRRS